MISFQVNDMTCGHCVSSITKALKAVDPAPALRFDLAARRVDIASHKTNAVDLGVAIRDAGYMPLPLQDASRSEATGTRVGTKRMLLQLRAWFHPSFMWRSSALRVGPCGP
jgi:copper chaperone